jgi:transposase
MKEECIRGNPGAVRQSFSSLYQPRAFWRAQVEVLAQAVQEVRDEHVELTYVDKCYTGGDAAQGTQTQGVTLEVVKHLEAKRGFVLLPSRWVAERSFAWKARFRRLAKDYERLPETVRGLHLVAFTCLMLHQLVSLPPGFITRSSP